eukprot:1166190-Amorphochlora_amoeboformis.AAC.2
MATSGDFSTSVEKLKKWLQANGARFPKVSINRYATEGRDLRTTGQLEKGEEAIFIPRKCIIAISDGKRCKAGKAIRKEVRSFFKIIASKKRSFFPTFELSDHRLDIKSYFPRNSNSNGKISGREIFLLSLVTGHNKTHDTQP